MSTSADNPVGAAAGMAEGAAAALLSQVLAKALRERASSIHLEILEGARSRVRIRVDGILHDVPTPPNGAVRQMIAHLKAVSGLDAAESRVPQDGRCTGTMQELLGELATGQPHRSPSEVVDLRISTVPTIAGERVTVRVLAREGVLLGLDKISLLPREMEIVRGFCNLPSGLVLVTGPAGSGKTTVLYSMLLEIDRAHCAVFSVEDPVEYSFDDVSQIQLAPRNGLTYARALRQIMRHDPDVIMVGELIDLPTLEAAAQVVLTGHLVMSTTHASRAVEAIKHLLDMGIPPHMLNAALAGVVSMRLLRRLCPQCRQESPVSADLLPPHVAEFVRQDPAARFFEAPATEKACSHCGGKGYRGRLAAFEVLAISDAIRHAILGGDAAAIETAALSGGMQTMLQCALTHAAAGETSIAEVLRVIPGAWNS